MLSNKNKSYLMAMRLVENYSKSLNTFSWIWGGFAIDIYENRILRDHDDLDYLTLNLHTLIPEFLKLFQNDGWQTKLLSNGDLETQHTGIKIHLGHVELSDRARWTHDGEKGSILFPQEWLNTNPTNFCGLDVHVVEPEFQYVMFECPRMLNPDWKHRDKDILSGKYLREHIEGKGIRRQSIFEQVRDERK